MPDPLTLPGTIPGLLRKCSPIIMLCENEWDEWERGESRVVLRLAHKAGERTMWGPNVNNTNAVIVQFDMGIAVSATFEQVALDLSDPTGRAHAAWWLISIDNADPMAIDNAIDSLRLSSHSFTTAWRRTESGRTLSDKMVDTLRRVCLHTAIDKNPNHPHADEWRAALTT